MNMYSIIAMLLPTLESTLSQKFLSDFKSTDKNELAIHHFGLGLWIRNNLLVEDSVLYESFIANNYNSKDDMSAYIIASFNAYLLERCVIR